MVNDEVILTRRSNLQNQSKDCFAVLPMTDLKCVFNRYLFFA